MGVDCPAVCCTVYMHVGHVRDITQFTNHQIPGMWEVSTAVCGAQGRQGAAGEAGEESGEGCWGRRQGCKEVAIGFLQDL